MGSGHMEQTVALSTVVTLPLLNEFHILKVSFELFHGYDYVWYVRCDRPSERILASYYNVVPTVFSESVPARVSPGDQSFNQVVQQKMRSINDAWGVHPDAVVFLDTDLVITSEFLHRVVNMTKDLALTPNHHSENIIPFESFHGHFNSGFLLTKNNQFHKLWQEEFARYEWELSDQVSLNRIASRFDVLILDSSFNVGFWRSPRFWFFEFVELPADCQFFHVHLYQHVDRGRGWLERLFALHCLRYLKASDDSRHQTVLERILELDEMGWYRSSLAIMNT